VLGYINAQTLAVKRLLVTGRVEQARSELDTMEGAARNVYADVREAILGLRQSLPRKGLVPALREYLEEYAAMSGLRLGLEEDGDVEGLELKPEVEIQLVRIVQEALANVRKHAHASHGAVRLTLEDGTLRVEVSDDGRGFDQKLEPRTGWPRFGLQTMQERAQAVGGRFHVASAPGEGTRVSVELPVSRSQEVAHAARAG
jgi:two-component system nitrate/nitrite sensor histidine kinase NarX